MKTNIILAALGAILSFAGVSTAQSLRLTFSEPILNSTDSHNRVSTLGPAGEGKTVTIDFCKIDKDKMETLITYTGLESPNAQLFEAVLPASSAEACLATRDFSMAVPVGPERAIWWYDPGSNSGNLRWFLERNDSASCRVLLLKSSADTTDYAVWRTSFGVPGFSSDENGRESFTDQKDAAPQRSMVTSLVVTFQGARTNP